MLRQAGPCAPPSVCKQADRAVESDKEIRCPAVVICIGLANLSSGALNAQAEEAKMAAPQVVLAETYNAVTSIYFTNIAVHKGAHKPGLVARRFRADVKYWLMDAKYYAQGELSIGNPPLVELVRQLGSTNRGIGVDKSAARRSC